MKVSDKGIAEIISHEAIVPMPYRDSVGVWTFGVGHTANAGPPNPLDYPRGKEQPLSEVIRVFRKDLAKFEARVNSAIKVPVSQSEFDAAVSFDFNTGGIYKATWVKLLNQGNRAGAARAMMNWNKPPEIKKRREKEQRLFRDGVYSSGGFANVYPATTGGSIQWSKGRRVNVAEVIGTEPGTPELGLTKEQILDAQTDLAAIGIDPGPLDGIWGPKTEAAVLAFQKSRDDLADTGVLDPQTDAALDMAADDVTQEEPGQPDDPGPAPSPDPEEPESDGWIIRFLRWLFRAG